MVGADGQVRHPLERFAGRALAGLVAVTAAGVGFGVLLMLVRFRFTPLYAFDQGVAERLNELVAPHHPLVTVLEAVTRLGGRPIMLWLVAAAVVGLFIRRQRRLAMYLVVTGVGALLLDPSLKLLVGRLRPVVEVPVLHAPGNSFPSGHALGSMVTYGALLLVFLPAMGRRSRGFAAAFAAAVVIAVGFTRIALGVHFVSDVLGGWLLGVAWLGVTSYAFQLWRREAGRPVPPITEGLEPEAAPQIAPAPDEHRILPHPRAAVAELITGLVLIFGALFGFGMLVSYYAKGTFVATVDTVVPQWLAAHRTPTLNEVSWYWSKAGDTHAILFVSLIACPLMLAMWRRWRPVLFLALTMFGELGLFLATAEAVDRPRPAVEHLDGKLPTAAFPSGHIAATMCLYTAIALLVMPRTRRWWRWLTVAAAVVMPLGVALSRMYRGMHHPTDFAGAFLLTLMLITLLWWVIRPNADRAPDEIAGSTAPVREEPGSAPPPRAARGNAAAGAAGPDREASVDAGRST